MARKEDSTERLEGWKGVITGADPDVIPDDASPAGANAAITHFGLDRGVVRRRKGAVTDGIIEGNTAVLGMFDYYSSEWGRIFIAVSDDGSVSAVRVNYTIDWDPLDTFAYETAINTTDHLNATAEIAGTFSYSLPVGTILDVGSWPLTMTFTPDDLANYAVKQETVTLTVTKKTVVLSWATPAEITYGTVLSGTQLNATADEDGGYVYTPAAGTTLPAGTHTLSAEFTPTDPSRYIGGTITVSLSVAKATPVITWANPGSIYYGTALSGTQLNATADVAGVFTYTPPSGTVLNAGIGQTLHVDFVPTDTANYNNADADAAITVNKAWPVITWSNPSDITYGTVLSGTQLNATADVPGSFVYDPPAGTLLNAGAGQNLDVDFTPTDTDNYELIDATVQITVNKATPVITWSNPADIRYPAPLSATQLNATTDVAGAFVYDPVSGTVLSVGDAQALDTTFTPTDGANYNLAYKTVYINVLYQLLEEYWLDGEQMQSIYNGTLDSNWIDGEPNAEPGL